MQAPGEKLVKSLDVLRLRLGRSGVERTVGLADNLGKDCGYYKKSLSKFLEKDYVDIRNQIRDIYKLLAIIEGEPLDE